MHSIIIPTYNNIEGLKKCLDSIFKYTDMTDKEIIVVFNNDNSIYKDNFKSEIKKYNHPSLKIIYNDKPLGYANAVNQGIICSTGQNVILLNDDTILLEQEQDQWIDILQSNMEDETSVVGPLALHQHGVDFIVFFCCMINRKTIEEVGFLDSNFLYGGMEDVDWCYRAEKLGYTIKEIAGNSFPIYHQGEQTVHTIENWEEKFNKNIDKLKEKKKNKIDSVIITPFYNDINNFKNTLKGIINQTYKNWDLYIVNDCSDYQQSVALYKEVMGYQNNLHQIKIVNNDINLGPSESRNKILNIIERNKEYEYIFYCDSDDYWLSNHMVKSIHFIKENNLDLVYCKAYFQDEKGTEMFSYGIQQVQEFDIEKLENGNFIYISSVCHNRKCLSVGPFNYDLDSIEDWDYWLRIAKAGFKLGFNENDCISYTCKENGMASKFNNTKEDMMRNNLVRVDELPKDAIVTYENDVSVTQKKPQIKLNLGCGDDLRDGYINCDMYNPKADMQFDAAKCPFEDESVDEIMVYHLIEHFDFKEGFEVLNEWNRVLKKGGRIVLETPDLLNTCKVFVESDEDYRIKLYGHFFAWPWEKGQQHKFLYTETQMAYTLTQCGFENIKRLPPDSIYVHGNPKELYLKVEAFKK